MEVNQTWKIKRWYSVSRDWKEHVAQKDVPFFLWESMVLGATNIRNTDGTTSCHHDFSWNLPSLWGYLGHNQGFLLAAAADTNRVGQVWVGWGSSLSHTCEVVQLLKHLTSRRCFFSWLFFCWWFHGKVRLVILPWFFKDVDLQVRADFSWQAYQDLMEGGGVGSTKRSRQLYILVVLSSKPTA